MRNIAIARSREELLQSKNSKIQKLAQTGCPIQVNAEGYVDLEATHLLKALLPNIQSNNSPMDLIHTGISTGKILRDGQQFLTVNYAGFHLLNPNKVRMDIEGEITISLRVCAEGCQLESIESSSSLLDQFIRGEKIALITWMQIFTKLLSQRKIQYSRLEKIQNEIEKQLQQSGLTAAKRIALLTMQSCTKALAQSRFIREELSGLVKAAWEMYHSTPNHFSENLKQFDAVLSSTIFACAKSKEVKWILEELEKKIDPLTNIEEINRNLAEEITQLIQKNNLKGDGYLSRIPSFLSRKLSDPENQRALSFQNPQGFLMNKISELQMVREDVRYYFEGTHSDFLKDFDALIHEAQQKLNEQIYCLNDKKENNFLAFIAAVLPKKAEDVFIPKSISSLVDYSSNQFQATTTLPNWKQFFRRLFNTFDYQKTTLKQTLSKIVENTEIELEEKLLKIQQETQKAREKSEKSFVRFFQKPIKEDLTKYQEEAKALCATKAFSKGEINIDGLIFSFEQMGEKNKAVATHLKKIRLNIENAAKNYSQDLKDRRQNEFREPAPVNEKLAIAAPIEYKSVSASASVFANHYNTLYQENQRKAALNRNEEPISSHENTQVLAAHP